MCSWCPADVMCGSLAINQRVCFKVGHMSMLSLVLWTTSCGTMRVMGCGMWSGVRAGHPLRACVFFSSSSTGGYIRSTPGYRSRPHDYFDGPLR